MNLMAALMLLAAINTPFWTELGPGRYEVGFRTLYARDHRHAWSKSADPGRPICVSVWYPAHLSSRSIRMTYGDYLHHTGPADFQQLNDQLDRMDADSWLSDLGELVPDAKKTYERLLALPAAAHRDASAAAGRFPLVLYSGGKASRGDANVELAEFLASHGYVVATVPQLGPSDREIELGSSPREIALHADDFEAALAALHNLDDIDFSRIATGGHSAGGEVAAELAMRHPEVSAVFGLDASFGMSSGARVFEQLPEYVPHRRIAAALLDLRRSNGSQGVKLDLTAIDALHWSHVSRVMIDNAYHGDFTEWGMVAYVLGIPMPPNTAAHTRALGHRVNVRTCHAVLDFLDGHLRAAKRTRA